MNEVIIKKAAWVVGGMIFGGLAGYFTAELVLKKLLEEDELLRVLGDEVYREQIAPYEIPPTLTEEEVEAFVEENFPDRKQDYTKSFKILDPKPPLEELARKYEPTRVIDLDEYMELIAENAANQNDLAIDEVTFYAVNSKYVLEPTDLVVEYPNSMFGANAHLHFGESSDDEDLLYILNETLGTIFKITRVNERYEPEDEVEETSAEKPEPKKKPVPPRRRGAVKPKEGDGTN